jgi:peptide/nickel transport system substrate-binding protein
LNNSDSQYSNSEYDKLYTEQAEALNASNPSDLSKRQAIVWQMEQIVYRDCPDIILWYNVNLEAYRSDKWTGYVLLPPGHGAPFRNMLRTTYQNLQPRTAVASSASTSRAWIWAVVVAVAAAVVATIVVIRRRSHGAEVE